MGISDLPSGGPALVKISPEGPNQQETNVSSSKPVGSPETTRATEEEVLFNQWLAGLIDGDGCFLVSKQGYTSCEITLGLADESALRLIQHRLGGSLKLRSGAKAYRWRLHHKAGMLELLSRVNGEIRTVQRQKQLDHVCQVLSLVSLPPRPLSPRHGWFSGFFDAEGSLSLSLKGPGQRPQLTLSVTNLLRMDVAPFETYFGGAIYYDRAQNGYYKWSIQSKEALLSMLDYFHHCPSRTSKKHRLHLVKAYYELLTLGAWKKDPLTQQPSKAWRYFWSKWQSSSGKSASPL